MFRKKIIYRLIVVFLFFAGMTVVPFSYTVIRQVDTMLTREEAAHPAERAEIARFHGEVVPQIVEAMVPFVFYILVLALILSIFFLRKMLMSLKELRRGSLAMKDGHLDIELKIVSEDELGDAARAFNEMASSLRKTTEELKQKDVYINAMLDPLWVVDEDDAIADINPAFTRLFGYEREEALGTRIYDFFDEKNAALMRRQLREKRERGLSSIYEIDILQKNGTPMPVLISGSPIYSDGRIVGKIGILKDFREQRRLRNELQRSKEYVETIMDGIEDRLLVIDKDYRIIKANRIAAADAGRKVVGEYCHVAAHGIDRPCWTDGNECPARTVFAEGGNFRVTHRHVGADGEKKYHEVVASPIRDASGNVVQVIELVRDVSDRVRHEEEIFNKNRELIALNSVAGILSGSLRPDEIFTQVLDKVIEMMRMDGGGMFFIDDAGKEMQCQYHRGVSDEFVKLLGRIRVGDDIPGRVAATGRLLATPDISKDRGIERSMIKHSGIKGYCCIPVRGKERIIGVFCLFSHAAHTFTSEEENILNAIGEMTGIAVENIRLYESMRELYEYQRKRREDEQEQMLTLTTKLGSAIELKDVISEVLDAIRNIFSADFVWLLARDGGGNLAMKSAYPPQDGLGTVVYPKGVSSIEGYSLDKKTPTLISDMTAGSKFYLFHVIRDLSFQSAIALPMFIGEKAVGVYSLYYRGTREFKEEELHFLRIIANMLAVAMERSSYYVRAITEKGLSETILQSVADGIITVDAGGRTISINRAFEKTVGVRTEDAVGIPICNVLRFTEENDDFRFALGECIDKAIDGNRASREALLVTVFGNRITTLISSAPIFDAGGQVTGVVNVLRDIGKEKEVDRMKTELIRSVSHEFRTPLSAIVGMTEMILEGVVEESVSRQYLSTILSEGLRLSNMVSDLLSIARIESGKDGMRPENIDLGLFLGGLKESFASLFEKKKAVLKYDIDGVKSLVGDPEKLRQLFSNLVDNSLLYSEEGCVIEIRARKHDGDIEIVVADSGWGIPEEDLPHLTERFYRGEHGARIKGTGLGLAICSEIIKMHGGTMQIKSRPGVGTEVTLFLPYRGVA